MNKVRVLIVDDSPIVRSALVEIFSSDSHIEVIGTADDPYVAVDIIKKQIPDVITLDIELPRMDGLTFLKKIMSQHPIPVVVISSLTKKGTEVALKALEYGATDVLLKPKFRDKNSIAEAKIRICDSVKAAAVSKFERRKGPAKHKVETIKITPKLSADVIIKGVSKYKSPSTTEKIIAVGASTGGTEAISKFLQAMPADTQGIVIVQHMPEHFTHSFAERLNSTCKMEVKEAEDGDEVRKGRALVAPGNKHMLLKRTGSKYYVQIMHGPLVNRHRPSVDVLFRTVAINAGNKSIGVIMTGMGDDGAIGIKEMKESGATTIAQDEKSCVVFGMPHEAIKTGAIDHIVPLDKIAENVLRIVN